MSQHRSKHDHDALNCAIAKAREGNPEAFETVVRQCEKPLRAWLATICPPGIESDEIAQQSFIVAYTRLDHYQLGTNFKAWLFTIAKFELRTEITRLRRVADYHTKYAPDLMRRELERRSELSPNTASEKIQHLQKCKSNLGENLRQYLTWRYEEQVPLEEMASRSGRSVTAIKKQLWKIRQLLHECVQRQLLANGDNA
ncbi:MAG: sigma-70 family RNA polymerase sigma factor [Pirellulaceae bacterium]|nr:sigma-70 family RNA polymerase sigma factor [Pirellulaceae bacterium]